MDTTGERLRTLRGEQLQLAVSQNTGISRSSLSQYENGMRPPLDALISLASYYHVSLDYLAGLSNEINPHHGQLGDLFSKVSASMGSDAPTASDMTTFLEALIRYSDAGKPCGTIPLKAWKGFIAGLTASLNAAATGDTENLIDNANKTTIAALEVTKMPATLYENRNED